MSNPMLITKKLNRVGLIIIDRPKAINAINQLLLDGLLSALSSYDQDDHVQAIVLAGSDKAFSVGADINALISFNSDKKLFEAYIRKFRCIGEIRKPIIAAVSGWCLGGGNELAMACDMIIASETAVFGQPEINLGLIPGAGGTQRLLRSVGKAVAMEMILNNRLITAQEALSFGLINRVVDKDSYLNDSLKLADDISQRAPLAIYAAKKMINIAFDSFLSDGINSEMEVFESLLNTVDSQEGLCAFLEKRNPQWKGN